MQYNSKALLCQWWCARLFVSRKRKDVSYVEPKVRGVDERQDDVEWDYEPPNNRAAEPTRMTIKTDAVTSLLAVKRDSLRYQELELEHYDRITAQNKTSLNEIKLNDPLYEIPDS